MANANKSGLYARSIEQVLRLREDEVDLATAALTEGASVAFDGVLLDVPKAPPPPGGRVRVCFLRPMGGAGQRTALVTRNVLC